MSFHKYVIYQIYPKSFYDTKGDGFGDLRGIIDKIPYIASLGVDMVWFNPFFVSPQRDNGYDIADYYQIQPAMGTMDDFDELVEQLAAHNIGVMLDMVFNHTSTAHEWFQKALTGDEKYRDYYIIRPGLEDGSPPTNWESKFGGSAWEPFGDTGEFYLHLFDVTQADLNWRNPKVREEMANIVNFWMDRGVFGFRFDVISLIGKEAELKSSALGEDPAGCIPMDKMSTNI
ncbi:MAG: alpha-amylase family glycosyl hydrolase [Corynebacterium sp.]|nr:alpha-amylase family glycosyl hydrolase [Corynebacterium sp.]